MKFGIFFELQLPRPWGENDEYRLYQNALEWAEIADRVGVGYAWAQEHHFLEEYSHSTAPEVFLAACSQRTKRLRLGHGIALMPPAYNHPARVAERIAALDLVSGGRVEWGTGESSSRIELEGFGVNYAEKRAMWAEAVREAAKMMSAEPYPGHRGEYFSMPPRNIVPKPRQKPHPPLWVACTNRDTMKLAARLGAGALTFAFMDAGEAKFWVEEYYETFRRECEPIGRAVNPNIAVLMGLSLHHDAAKAHAQGDEGQSFFAYGLAHYYRFGAHRPGRTNLWEEFKAAPPFPMAGMAGVGTPDEVRENFEKFEAAGVDQLIMLQQAGRYSHEQICESLELFGREVLPGFEDRHEAREREKQRALAPYVEAAHGRIPPLVMPDPMPEVEAYPRVWDGRLAGPGAGPTRQVGADALWRLAVGGARKGGAGP